MHKCLYLL